MSTTTATNEMLENIDELTNSEDFLRKVKMLRETLQHNLEGSDALWTLFVAAASNYRYETLLKPFPLSYYSDKCRKIDELLFIINDTPNLKRVLQILMEDYYPQLDPKVLDLLYWIVAVKRYSALQLLDATQVKELFKKLNQSIGYCRPTQVFRIPQSICVDEAFKIRRNGFSTQLVFFGCKLEEYFCILNNGFGALRKTNTVMSDLVMCLRRTPYSPGWGGSLCGSMITCVTVCELIMDPAYIQTKQSIIKPQCLRIIVKNCDLLRMKYLLFYSRHLPASAEDNKVIEKSEQAVLVKTKSIKKYIAWACVMTAFLFTGFTYTRRHPNWEIINNKAILVSTFIKRTLPNF